MIGLGREVLHPFHRAGGRDSRPVPEPGATPGIEAYLQRDSASVPVHITCLDYGAEVHESREVDSIGEALGLERKTGTHVRWLNIYGLAPALVDQVCREFNIHTLAAEDVLNTTQRPKLEVFDDHLFVTIRQIQLQNDRLRNEQLALFCFKDTVLAFHEKPGDVFDPVRKRIEKPTSRFRERGPDYLLYALIDCIVDHLYPLLEGYGFALEALEEEISSRPRPSSQQRLFSMKRDLAHLRRAVWPVREVVDGLYRDESGQIPPSLTTFLRDVQDHAMQVLDLLESYRETASGLGDLYQSSVGNRMNEIMKLLTIMASFFIPITFIAGVYGMNFQHIPELQWRFSYFVFWCVCLLVSGGLAFYFWRKGWIGRDSG